MTETDTHALLADRLRVESRLLDQGEDAGRDTVKEATKPEERIERAPYCVRSVALIDADGTVDEVQYFARSDLVPRAAVGPEEAARYLGIGRATLYELMASGRAPPSIRIGRRRLFRLESLDKWLRNLESAQAGDAISTV